MKKLITLALVCLGLVSAHAGDSQNESIIGINKKKGMISNGVYLHLGLGFPSISNFGTQSLGIQPTFEFGNQWMFYKNDNFGIGMNVSWLTIGGSSKAESGYRVSSFHLGLLKFGPMASFSPVDNIAIDAYFNFSPTMYFGAYSYEYATVNNAFIMYGLALAPGAKFRYKKLAVGFEVQLGRQTYVNSDLEDDDDLANFKVSYVNPRLLVGFKF